jgi:hypothetical protein
MVQSFKFTGSSDLSELEGESQRYIRVEFSFSLRTLLMRQPPTAPDQNGNGGPVQQVQAIEVTGAIPDSTYGDLDLNDQVSETFGQAAIQSLNLFNIPVADYLIPSSWPVTGPATVSRGRRSPGGYFLKPPGNSLYFEVTGSAASAPIVSRQLAPVTGANSIVSISFQYLSNGPVMLECTQEDPATGIITMAFELELPAQTTWTRVHVFALVSKSIFSWNITGIGTNPKTGITVANIDARHIAGQTLTAPSAVITTLTETQYVWYNVPPGSALVVALLLSDTGVGDTLSVDNDVMAPTYTNQQPVSASVNVGLVALIQPLSNSIRARVPLTVTLASVGLQGYAGGYNGHDLSQT